MNANVKELVLKMTLEEKAAMCSGADFWHTESVERLGIPAVMVSDGPHGLRKQDDKADHLGMNDSIKAVCFPAACATASSFDKELMYQLGETLGQECQAEQVAVLLGPAVNIKRSPLCGRNFEYVSEDPFLTGKLSAQYIAGVQSQNIGTSMKHFAVNSQEHRRMTSSSNVDERTLREIYLSAFEMAVKEVQPWTLMCSYNQINGSFASENKTLLNDILREEWGFEGAVMSDWGAVNDRVPGIQAGMDLEMPGSNGCNDSLIIKAVQNGTLSEEVLNIAVERILNFVFKYVENQKPGVFDRDADHEKAYEISKECMVLLKNENILPLKKGINAAFIGEFAQKPRIQGGGSSHINCHKIDSVLDYAENVVYAKGYSSSEDVVDEKLEAEAIQAAQKAEVAVIFAGLPDSFESEGYDRSHLNLPECQNRLIEKIADVQPNIVVVLHNGSPVIMPWLPRVKGVLEAYLGGEAMGHALADILYGEANPCGKLAETFPLRLEDTPCYLNFPGNNKTVEYQEGVFVGYRWYDSRKMDVLFPFGYGMSYTSFAYSNLKVDKKEFSDTDTVKVSVDVTNTGDMTGKEIVQLYIADKTGAQVRPAKELKGFEKVSLKPGETKTVTMELNCRSFAWYDVENSNWYCAPGKYEILIGESSRSILLTAQVEITSSAGYEYVVTRNTCCGELLRNPKTADLIKKQLLSQFAAVMQTSEEEDKAITDEMQASMSDNMPLRALRSFDSTLDNEKLDQLVKELNLALNKNQK